MPLHHSIKQPVSHVIQPALPVPPKRTMWPRMEKGMPALVESVKKGMNAMPPTGMCSTCTDEDYAALIEFMAAPAPTN